MDDITAFAASMIDAMRTIEAGEDRVAEVKRRISKVPELLLDQNYDRLMHLVDSLLGQPRFRWGDGMDIAEAILAAGSDAGYQDTLSRLIARCPGDFWIWYFWAKAGQGLRTPETYWRRARYASDRFPGDRRLHHLLMHAGMQARHFADVLNIPDLDLLKDGALTRCKAQTYLNLRDQFVRPVAPDYGIYCVNLDHHDSRLDAFKADLDGLPLALRRVPGIRGSYLPNALSSTLARANPSGAPSRYAGAFGCFLAHVAAWEAFLRTSDSFALVVEDDAHVIASLPMAIELLDLPNDTDIVFVNDRTECLDHWKGPIASRAEFVTLETAMASRPKSQNATGGDGYILSREGARKALGLVGERGFAGDVDWWLALAAEPQLIAKRTPIDPISDRTWPFLKGFSLFPSLITSGRSGSAREVESDLWRRYL